MTETTAVYVAWPHGWNYMHYTFDNVFASLEDAIEWVNQYGDETYADWQPEAKTDTEVHHTPRLEDGVLIPRDGDGIPGDDIPMVVEVPLRHNLTDEYRIIPRIGVQPT